MGFIRKRRWREGLEGQSVEGGDYFKYFRSSNGDDYSRKEINQGTAITAIIPARKYGNLQWTVARKNSNEL